MEKKYTLSTVFYPSRPRSKRLRALGGGGSDLSAGATVSNGGGSAGPDPRVDQLVSFNKDLSSLLIPMRKNDAGAWTDLPWSRASEAEALRTAAGIGFSSSSFLSSRGIESGGSGSGGGTSYNRLDAWDKYTADKAGYVLSAFLGNDLNTRLSAIEGDYAKKSDIPSLSRYATQQWVEARGYLTQLSLHSLTIKKNGVTVDTYNPSADKTIDITDVASAATLLSHTGDMTAHITATERTKWNKTATDFAAIVGVDSDSIINKWEEVIAFLATYTEADTLAGLLSNKVDKVSGKGLSTNDFTDTLLAKLNGIESGANKYVHPTHTATNIAAANGSVLTAITVDALGHVSSVSSKTLAEADIPSLSVSKIRDLQSKLDLKLDKSVFDDLFEKVNIGTASAPVYAIRAKYGLFSNSFISSRGGESGGSGSGSGGGTSYNRLDAWDKYTADKAGYVLSAFLGKDLDTRLSAIEGDYAKKSDIPSLAKYATQQWVEAKGYALASALNDYVTTNTAQEISGKKIFSGGMSITGGSTENTSMPFFLGIDAFADGGDVHWLTASSVPAAIGVYTKSESDGKYLTSHQRLDHIECLDTRSSATTPSTYDAQLRVNFKENSVNGLNDGGSYNGELHLKYYGGTTDHTGGYPHQLGFTINGNIWHRIGANSTTWGTWHKLLDDTNYSSVLDSRYLRHAALNGGLVPSTATTWGNSTGTQVAEWTDNSGNCAFKFLKDNPTQGRMSMLIDGTVYINEGQDAVASQTWVQTWFAPLTNLSNYVTLHTAQTIDGYKTFRTSLTFDITEPDGGRAHGISGTINGTAVGSVGFLCDNNVYQGAYIGWGPNPYSVYDSLFVSAYQFTYKNNAILHAGNYASILDSRYVNADGDSMSDALTINSSNDTPLHLNGYGGGCYIQMKADGNILGYYGATSSGPVWHKDGIGNKLWHSGNMGPGSNLNADLLDGVHLYNIAHRATDNLFDNNAGYLFIPCSSNELPSGYGTIFQWGCDPQVTPATQNTYNWYNQLYGTVDHRLYYRVRTNGGAWTGWRALAYLDDKVADADKLDGYHHSDFAHMDQVQGTSSDSNIGLLKSAHSRFADSMGRAVRLEHGSYSMAFGWFLGGYPLETAYGGWFISDYATPRWIGVSYGNWFDETFAFLSSNVASATKLQTTRLIWGHYFDGTNNVDNTLHLHHSGSGNYNEGIRLYGTAKDNTWSNILFGCDPAATEGTHANQWILGRNSSNNFILDVNDSAGNIMTWCRNGNVSIGHAADTGFKLYVNGTMGVGHLYTSGYLLSNKSGQDLSVLDYHGDGSLALNYGLATVKGLPCTIYGTTVVKGDLYADGMIQSNASASDSARMRVNCGNTSILTMEANANGRGLYDTTLQKYMWWFDGSNVFTNYDGNYGIGTTSPTEKLSVNGWVGTIGNTGWYSITHGGGWWMKDSTYIRNYNSRRLLIEGINDYYAVWLSSGGFCTEGYAGTSWNQGYGALNVGIANNDHQTPLLVAYRNGSALEHTGSSRLFSMEFHNSGWLLRLCFGGAEKFEFISNGVFHALGGIYAEGYVSSRGSNSSDERLKTDIRDFRASDIIRTLHPRAFRWNDFARSMFPVFDTKEVQYGLIAQEAKVCHPWLVDEDMFGDGYMGVFYDKLIPVLLQGENELFSVTDDHERRIKELEAENRELRKRIEILTA